MFHAALCWPDETNMSLWPHALEHAVLLHNHMPKRDLGLAPIELWTGTKSNYSMITNAQTWGCPGLILNPKLQDGHKIPKWDHRVCTAQFLGYSP